MITTNTAPRLQADVERAVQAAQEKIAFARAHNDAGDLNLRLSVAAEAEWVLADTSGVYTEQDAARFNGAHGLYHRLDHTPALQAAYHALIEALQVKCLRAYAHIAASDGIVIGEYTPGEAADAERLAARATSTDLMHQALHAEFMGERWEAAELFERACQTDPTHALAFYLLGRRHEANTHNHEAVEAYRVAARLAPNSAAPLAFSRLVADF